jgi:hypothetical protein
VERAQKKVDDGMVALVNAGTAAVRRGPSESRLPLVLQSDTLQLRLVKLAARVIEFETQIKIHLPSSAPEQAIFATLLHRLPYDCG